MPKNNNDYLKNLPLNKQAIVGTDDPWPLLTFFLLFFIFVHFKHLRCWKRCNSTHFHVLMMINVLDKPLPYLPPVIKCLVVVLKLYFWALLNHLKFLGRLRFVIFIWRGAHFNETFAVATGNAPRHSARTPSSSFLAAFGFVLLLQTRMKNVAQSAWILKLVLNSHGHKFVLTINKIADLLWHIDRCFL